MLLMISKRGGFKLVLVVFFILVSSLTLQSVTTHAFGLSTPYLENDTLKLEPGQQYNYTLKLQNNDDETYDIEFKYSSDRNIAKLILGNNTLKKKTYDNKFVFRIVAPYDALKGEKYVLKFYARPLLNLTGQVPMVVQISRSLTVLIVDENGQGEKLSFFEKMNIWQKRNHKLVLILIKILVALIILAIMAIIILRFWKISKGIVTTRTITTESDGPKASRAISECKSVEELTEIIEQLPGEAFNLQEIKTLLSEKFLEINERFLSQKVLFIKSKKEMIFILKK